MLNLFKTYLMITDNDRRTLNYDLCCLKMSLLRVEHKVTSVVNGSFLVTFGCARRSEDWSLRFPDSYVNTTVLYRKAKTIGST